MNAGNHEEEIPTEFEAPHRGRWQERVFAAVLVTSAVISLFHLSGPWLATSGVGWYLISCLFAVPVVGLYMWGSSRMEKVGKRDGESLIQRVLFVFPIFVFLVVCVGVLLMGPVMIINKSLATSETTALRGELVSRWEDRGNAALPGSRHTRGIVVVWEGEKTESRMETTSRDWRRLDGMEKGMLEKVLRRGALGIEYIDEVRPLNKE
ncbi:MAG: hypothetical protein JJU11_04975 [Candidatus Sumerlaeia bacterium]|nr:hypothetical protein [Candidatus Sumerlaeia bacterium]